MDNKELSPEAEYRLAVYNHQREQIAKLEAQAMWLKFALGALLTVLAALAVAYLLTTGRVPMILARLSG